MFDIVDKSEYFELLTARHADRANHSLKGIQDGWIMGQLAGVKGKRLLEIGGGNSRVLPRLAGNTLYNAEKYEGVGNGPVNPVVIDGVTVIPTYMGEFSKDAPEVDIIFSISVIEHIPFDSYEVAFQDMARCLAPGGVMYHAIDIVLGDHPLETASTRILKLYEAIEAANLEWAEPPVLKPDLTFSARMASNSDITMWQWTQISEASRASAPDTQAVTIKLIARKPA
jgi:hypothetical protein